MSGYHVYRIVCALMTGIAVFAGIEGYSVAASLAVAFAVLNAFAAFGEIE